MKKKYIIIIVAIISIITILFLEKNNPKVVWKTEHEPVISIFPFLNKDNNIIWEAHIISKNSFLSVPGKSAYKFNLYILNASSVITNVATYKDYVETSLPKNTLLPCNECENLKWYTSIMLNKKLFVNDYNDENAYYSLTNDVLYITLITE